MTDTEIQASFARIETLIGALQAAINGNLSPYVKGDTEAAKVAGFKSRAAFKRYAEKAGIRPVVRGGINFWDRVELLRGEA